MTIYEDIMSFYNRIKQDEYHRYKSWEHCYGFFNSNDHIDIDYGSLHLAFFLASWGMYRGSGDLLWKDYRIHKPVLEYLINQKEKFKALNNIEEIKDNDNIEFLLFAVKQIKQIYKRNIKIVDGIDKEINVSNTLSTKILLGIFGCVPAFDRFFISGLHKKEANTYSLNRKTLKYLYAFCRNNCKELKKAREKIKTNCGFDYPIMKIIDMYFWEIGRIREEEIKKEKKKNLNTAST